MDTVITAINVAIRVYAILLIVRILLSWIRHNPYQPVIKFIYEVSEPYLKLFRRIIPPIGMMDLSPIIALLVLDYLIRPLVINILYLIFSLV